MAALIALSGLALPCVALAQSFDPTAARERRILERIEQEEARNGPESAGLTAPLTALGLFYAEDGEHELAVAAFERARHVVHVNRGLHSLEEAPLLRQLVRVEEAGGRPEIAWNLEQELLELVERYPDDLRTVPIFHEIADKRVDLLEHYAAGETPPQIVLGCYYGSDKCTAGSRQTAILAILADAQGDYARAINVLIRNDRYSSGELRELEMAIARSAYLYGDWYFAGRSLRRLYSYEVESEAPPLSRIAALVRIADHDMLVSRREPSHNKYRATLELYERAYRELVEDGVARASIDRLFAPETPVVLPAFLPNPLASERTSTTSGHIDVAFDITRYGESKHVETLETSNATRTARRRLVRTIKDATFRPRVGDGRLADTSHVVVRYYLSE